MCAKGTGTYGPYALSANLDKTVHTVPTYSQDVTIFAHEMGHNWSNYHTHDCGWGTEANPRPNSGGGPIDCCGGASEPSCNGTCNVGHPSGGGTIMSYCHLVNGVGVNFNKGFHPVVRSLMQSLYNSKTCTVTCPNSCPSDLTLSNETLSGTKEASNSITTSGTVSIGEETTLSAPTVTLNSGFTCAAGKSLTINTTGCTAEALAATYIPKALKNVLENEEIKATKTTNSLRISPNPFRKRTTISYEVAQEGPISLAIFDNRGRLVKQLIKTVAAAGVYTVDYQEDALEEGLFYIVFRTATGISSEKIIMLK
jgi:hypothetical protein